MASYQISNGEYGPKLTLEGPWTEDLLQICQRELVEEIVIIRLRDPAGMGLAFLQEVPRLKCFKLQDKAIDDISGIHFLTGLRQLYMSDYSGEPIDLLRFPQLTTVYMEYTKNRKSVGKCIGLEELSLQHYSLKDLSSLTDLVALRELWFSQGSLGDISSIGKFANLKSCTLALLRNLVDLTPLAELRQLEILELDYSKNFTNLRALSGMTSLKKLNVSNCGELESLRPLLDCPNLETLFFGQTTILDGDMDVLLQMPNLKILGFNNKRHYTKRREDIPAFWNCPFEKPIQTNT